MKKYKIPAPENILTMRPQFLITITDELLNWFEKNSIDEYELVWRQSRGGKLLQWPILTFKHEQDFILFKLRWC